MQSSPVLPTSLQWRPFAAPTTTHLKKNVCIREAPSPVLSLWLSFGQECELQIWETWDSQWMWLVGCVIATTWEDGRKVDFTEEQSTLLGVPALSLHKARSKSHSAAASFCRGPPWSCKQFSYELRYLVSHSEYPGGKAGSQAGKQTQHAI